MKKTQLISILVLIAALIIMGVHVFITPLGDWTVRIAGIVMLIDLTVVAYSTVQSIKSGR